jgi:hypothetical protein
LPDAPSSAAGRESRNAPSLSLASTPPLNLAVPNGLSILSLSYVGLSPLPSNVGGANQQPAGFGGFAENCAGRSAAKGESSGWFNSLLDLASRNQHYCPLGEGGFWKRGTYALGQAFAAHRYDNTNSFAASQLFAPGAASGLASGYGAYSGYSYQYDAGQRLATRYATGVGRDTLKNMFREFWPDVSGHVLHRKP